jgi:hypothetical protein
MKNAFTIFLLTVASFAQAGSKPRTIDFTQPLRGFDGKEITQPMDGKKLEVMTLGDASVIALESVSEEDRSAAGNVKFERDVLARKIYKNSGVVLKVEEVALLKERIGRVFGPSVIGAAWPLLDPSEHSAQAKQ